MDAPQKNYTYRGPAQAWDTHNGSVVQEMLGDVQIAIDQSSDDGRYLAVKLGDGTLRILDWNAGQESRIDGVQNVNPLRFSPKGRWLVAGTSEKESFFIVNVASRQIALRLDSGFPFFSHDDRLLFANKFVWDLEANKKVAEIEMDKNDCDFSPDGRWLLVMQRTAPRPVEGKLPGTVSYEPQARGIDLWDLTTFERRFHRDLPRVGPLRTAFSRDGHALAMWLADDKREADLEMLDTATGKLLWSLPTKARSHGSASDLSPDGSIWLFQHDDLTATMFDVPTGQILWHQSAFWGSTRFGGITGILFHREDQTGSLQLLDPQTGEPKATLAPEFRVSFTPDLSTDSRHVVIRGERKRDREPYFWEKWLEKPWPELFGDGVRTTMVMETATGRELFRVANMGGWILSDDGSTLVTTYRAEGEQIVTTRVWDVHPHRAWTWAIGTVATLALVLFTAARSLRAWRKRTVPARPTSTRGAV